jgi:hypothetical protein
VALYTVFVDNFCAIANKASSVVESEPILALGTPRRTKSGTSVNLASTVNEGEGGQTGSALFLEVLQASWLEGTAKTISSKVESTCALSATVYVALRAIGHLREGNTIGVDQSEPAIATYTLAEIRVVLAVGNSGKAHSVLKKESSSTGQTGIA